MKASSAKRRDHVGSLGAMEVSGIYSRTRVTVPTAPERVGS